MRSSPLRLIVLGALLMMPTTARGQCRFPTASTGRALTYRFQPEITPDELMLHVTLEFEAGPVGAEKLAVPAHWAGETLQAMTNLRALSSGTSLEDGPAADTKDIAHRPEPARRHGL